MPSRLYCSFPLPLLFIRFVEGRGAIKFRIRCVMCVLFIRFVEGRGAIKFRIGCIMRVLFIRFVEGKGCNPFPFVLWGKVHHFLVGMSCRCNLPQIMR